MNTQNQPVLEVVHFTKTAETLYMSPPGVSEPIKKLEQACSGVLLSRDDVSFELTEQCQIRYRFALEREIDHE